MQAALAHGWRAEATFDPAAGGALRVRLEPTRAVASDLFTAIFERQCTRGEFDGQPVSADTLMLLERAGTGRGVQLLILHDEAAMETMLAHVVAANTLQMADPAFVDELKRWIRFDDTEAVRMGDGLFTGASANPSVPRWLGERLFSAFFTAKTRTTNTRSRFAVRQALPCSFPKGTTRRTGWRSAAATSALRCTRRRSDPQ